MIFITSSMSESNMHISYAFLTRKLTVMRNASFGNELILILSIFMVNILISLYPLFVTNFYSFLSGI